MAADAMKGDRQRYLDAGMDDYVSKPFRPFELFESVERVALVTSDDEDEGNSDGTISPTCFRARQDAASQRRFTNF
jgi:DNA-binding response OmpR family regulator